MKYRELGNIGLKVSEIAMGCEGFGEEDCRMAGKLFDEAEKQGVNYFDLYTPNPAVRAAVGEALKGRRDKFYIQSHLCSVWQDGQYKRTRNIDDIKAGVAEMMELLQTDYVDVGMIHYCDSVKDWEEIVKGPIMAYALELKEKGVIRHIGLSSHNPKAGLAAVESGLIEVLMFSVNPCYDLLPGNEDAELLFKKESYSGGLLNMDAERQALYETCQRNGVGITVMKAFGGGDLLDEKLSPAGVGLTANQCIHYALTRPGVACVLAGARSVEQLLESISYENASDGEKDYAETFALFPDIKWKGHCMYCSHCAPCPKKIDVASVTKFMNLCIAQKTVPETVRDHYELLGHYAGDCIQCGACESRCPFGVEIMQNMKKAKEIFGK